MDASLLAPDTELIYNSFKMVSIPELSIEALNAWIWKLVAKVANLWIFKFKDLNSDG